MTDNFDPNTLSDKYVRQYVLDLQSLVQSQAAELQKYRNMVENQAITITDLQQIISELRDEINRLKGEQGRPKIKPNKLPPTELSSDKQRHEPKPHHKSSKLQKIEVNREQTCRLQKEELPKDVRFKGYESVVVQDILFHTDNVCFKREKYYSPSQNKTYLAPLPPGFEGEFGPGVKAWVLDLYFSGGMSEPKILEVLSQAGLVISSGQISNFLTQNQAQFHQESAQVHQAGLESSPWQHLDDTSTRVDGVNQYCHIMCNPLYTSYRTLPHKDRLSVLKVLMGGQTLQYQVDEVAWLYLEAVGLANKWKKRLEQLPQDRTLSEAEINQSFENELKGLGVQQQQWVKEALAVAWYQSQVDYPVVGLLLCDDAPQFHNLVEDLNLCWIHEGRHYKKLVPMLEEHRVLLEEFEGKFWDYYRALLAYKQTPNETLAAQLSDGFEVLFSQKTGYERLDQRIAETHSKKVNLLHVLLHPEIPLHNNPAELGARQRVRKRDVSFGPRSQAGVSAWDTFQTLAETTKKLGINFYRYLHDRLCQTHQIENLAKVIRERAQQLQLGASWARP
jgi:hypothetical protein